MSSKLVFGNMPKRANMTWQEIWEIGKAISEGWGFWGSSDLNNAPNRDDMIRAWVDALREKGYSDMDIVFYGDWRDGRHIADMISSSSTYDNFKADVIRNARSPEEVHRANVEAYRDKIKQYFLDFQLPEEEQ